jgi:hypothetical protein
MEFRPPAERQPQFIFHKLRWDAKSQKCTQSRFTLLPDSSTVEAKPRRGVDGHLVPVRTGLAGCAVPVSLNIFQSDINMYKEPQDARASSSYFCKGSFFDTHEEHERLTTAAGLILRV